MAQSVVQGGSIRIKWESRDLDCKGVERTYQPSIPKWKDLFGRCHAYESPIAPQFTWRRTVPTWWKCQIALLTGRPLLLSQYLFVFSRTISWISAYPAYLGLETCMQTLSLKKLELAVLFFSIQIRPSRTKRLIGTTQTGPLDLGRWEPTKKKEHNATNQLVYRLIIYSRSPNFGKQKNSGFFETQTCHIGMRTRTFHAATIPFLLMAVIKQYAIHLPNQHSFFAFLR